MSLRFSSAKFNLLNVSMYNPVYGHLQTWRLRWTHKTSSDFGITWQVLVFGQVEQVKTIGKNNFNYEGVWCILISRGLIFYYLFILKDFQKICFSLFWDKHYLPPITTIDVNHTYSGQWDQRSIMIDYQPVLNACYDWSRVVLQPIRNAKIMSRCVNESIINVMVTTDK